MEKKVTLDEKGYRKFGMRDKVAYAAGDFGCNMSFSIEGNGSDLLACLHDVRDWSAFCIIVGSTDLGCGK